MGLKDAFNFRKPKKDPPAPANPPAAQPPASGPAGSQSTSQWRIGRETDGYRIGNSNQNTGQFQQVDTVVSQTDLAALRLDRLVETFTGGTPVLGKEDLLNPEQSSETKPAAEAPPPPEAADCELTGTVINGLYRIDGLLAQGGMGQVFLAWHMRDDKPVVLKLMLRKSDTNDTPFKRFMQECKVTHRLRHPNIVKVLDYGILLEGLKPYLVMEFVEGRSLRQIIRRKMALLPAETAHILCQACEGLQEVHGKGVIHRDLKPENIMVRGDISRMDNVKILDFGIAHLEKDNRFDERGWAVGSLGYMSPEQIMGRTVDHRTDVYSVGLIMYECITGRPPFKGKTPKETMALHVKETPVPPSQVVQIPLPSLVDMIIARALAKDPEMRYPSMLQMQADLQQLIPE